MSIDGKSNKQTIQGSGFEFILGAANLYGLVNMLI